jgi:glycosyltransferase involved in cell wall biosynthesis
VTVDGKYADEERMRGTMSADITVCTATISIRTELLERAKKSVENQTLKPKKHLIKLDSERQGHTKVLDELINEADTEYIAILDDDDELLPNHLELLYKAIQENDADLVYPHFKYSNLPDAGHLEKYKNMPWDNNPNRQVPITWLAKRQSILEVGGFSKDFDSNSYLTDNEGNRLGQDYFMIRKLVEANKIIYHISDITWIYHVGHGSTLGMPIKW